MKLVAVGNDELVDMLQTSGHSDSDTELDEVSCASEKLFRVTRHRKEPLLGRYE